MIPYIFNVVYALYYIYIYIYIYLFMCVRIYYTYTHTHACFSFQPDVRQEFWFVQRVEIQGFHLKSPCTRRCGRGRDLGSPNKFPGLNGLLVCLGLPGFAWVCPCPRACIPGPHPHNATLVSHLPPTCLAFVSLLVLWAA